MSNKTKSQAETTVNADKVRNDNKIDKQIHHKSFKHVICDMHQNKTNIICVFCSHKICAKHVSARERLTQTYIVIMMLHYDKIQFNLNLNQFKRIKCSVYRLSC